MDWQAILWIVLALGAAAFVKWGIPYIKSKVDIEKLNKLLAEVKELVELAEKLFGTGNDDLKLTYVFNEIKKFDFKITDDSLVNMIKEAFDALQAILAKEGKAVPTNETAVEEYQTLLAGKECKEFESSVLAASFNKVEDVAVKIEKEEEKPKKKSTKKITKE